MTGSGWQCAKSGPRGGLKAARGDILSGYFVDSVVNCLGAGRERSELYQVCCPAMKVLDCTNSFKQALALARDTELLSVPNTRPTKS